MKYRFLIITIFCIASLITLHTVQSQTTTTESSETAYQDMMNVNSIINSIIDPNSGLPLGVVEQVEVEQIPKIPAPGDMVSIKIISYLTNLNKAQIFWTRDGEIISSGIGNVNLTVVAPPSGESSTIQIRIIKEGGGEILQSITLSPADVDLIYEANTYAHPFYKGKKLFTSESSARIIALPNFVDRQGNKIPDSELVYTWKINDKVQEFASGYGRNVFIRSGTLIERPTNITVEVSAINSRLIAKKTIQIQTQKTDLVIYENNPLLGVVYEKAIQGTFLLERPQVDFEGVPYFFSTEFKDDPQLKYKWAINGVSPQTKSENENYLVLFNQKNEDGSAIISVKLEHANNILQSARAALELEFKKVNNTNNNEQNFIF